MKALTKEQIAKVLTGQSRIPLGFIPVARINRAAVGLLPNGEWISWTVTDGIVSLPYEATQIEVMNCLVRHFGGTSFKLSERMGLSVRTVEAWRCSRVPLTPANAYAIAGLLLEM